MAEDIEEFPENTSTIPPEDVETPVETQAEAAAPEQEQETEIETEEKSRIAKLRSAYAQQKREAAALRHENEILKGQRHQTPDQEVDRRARELANQTVAQQTFNKTCNDIYDEGVKAYGKAKFDASVRDMNATLGGTVPTALIEAMSEAGDAHKLWHYLAENSDILDDIGNLPAHRMGAAVAKLAAKINAPKQASKAPAPVRPVGGQAAVEVDIDKMSTAEYMRYMDAHDMKRRYG